MELIIPLLVILFLAGSISFLRPSKKMKFLAELRLSALKLGFKIDSSNAMKGMFKNDQSDLVSYQLRNTTFIKKGQFVREGDAMILYDPASLKFDQNFPNIEIKTFRKKIIISLFSLSPYHLNENLMLHLKV